MLHANALLLAHRALPSRLVWAWLSLCYTIQARLHAKARTSTWPSMHAGGSCMAAGCCMAGPTHPDKHAGPSNSLLGGSRALDDRGQLVLLLPRGRQAELGQRCGEKPWSLGQHASQSHSDRGKGPVSVQRLKPGWWPGLRASNPEQVASARKLRGTTRTRVGRWGTLSTISAQLLTQQTPSGNAQPEGGAPQG